MAANKFGMHPIAAGRFHCPPSDRRAVIPGLAIPFLTLQRAGHDGSSDAGAVRRPARGHGAPNARGARAPAPGPPGRGAPLPAVPRHRRQGPAARAGLHGGTRPARAAGRVQDGGARPLDRLVAGAAVPAPAPGLQRLPPRHPAPRRVPGLRRPSADIEAAHGRPGPARGDVRRRPAVQGDLPPRVGPVRSRRTTESRVHCVRGFTCDGDRCRAHVRNLPRSLSCLTGAAIAVVRCDGRFGHMPEAGRHRSARAREALDLIPGPPGT